MSVSHNRYEKNKGFTLIELLVAVAILATISIVAYASYSGYTKRSFNSERIAAIDYLKTSLETSYELKKTLPEPNSNFISYDERGSYLHSSTGAYGISGYASRDFLAAGYLNFSVLDPETKQFYGYGKLADDSAFDLATVLSDDGGGYKTYIRGNYKDDKLVSLIRSYSSSDFVSMDSTDALPYNPYERKITAQILAYSGGVTINDSPNLSLTGELNTGDKITVATGATARLHISDGSELFLGTASGETILELKNLTYSDDNNLASKVSLYLTSGEVWVEAPHLRTVSASASEYTIETDSAVATVRGTIFTLSHDTNGTHIGLVGGKLEVQKINPDGGREPFGISNGFSTNSSGNFVLEPSKSYMVVRDEEKSIILKNIKFGSPTATGTIDDATIFEKIDRPRFSPGYIPRVSKVSMEGGIGAASVLSQLSLTTENPGATSYELLITGNQVLTGALDPLSAIVTIQQPVAPASTPRTLQFRLCDLSECSAPFAMSVPKTGDSIKNIDTVGVVTVQDCPNDQQWFGSFGCQNKNLVAIAPYNHRQSFSGSIGMFTKDGKNILADQATLDESVPNKYIPEISWWVFKTDGLLLCNDILCKKDRLGNLKKELGMTFFQDHNIFEVATPNKLALQGLYIDRYLVGDSFVNYDLSKLNLGDNFSIEMRVRGAALKRSGSSFYHLFNLSIDGGGQLTLDYSHVYGVTVNLDSNPLKIFTLIPPSALQNLHDTAFYKVLVHYDKTHGTADLRIIWENWNTVLVWNDMGYTKTLQPPRILFIWSDYLSMKQWNDIIDYVKIYKQ